MADIIRIWDEGLQDYREYDTTVFNTEYVPVSNVSISRTIETGVVNKIIDINDISSQTSQVSVSQIFKPFSIEKSFANRFSIERSNAKDVSVEASRNEIVVGLSTIGQKGEKGEKGEDSVINFNPTTTYIIGDIVRSEDRIWIAKDVLNASTQNPSAIPAEGSNWSEISDHDYVDNLPYTNGYEISSQEQWDAIGATLTLGDTVRVANVLGDGSEILFLELFSETDPVEVTGVGRKLRDSNLREFFVSTSFLSGDNYAVSRSDKSLLTVAEFNQVLDNAGIIYGSGVAEEDLTVLSLGNSPPNLFKITDTSANTSTTVRITTISGDPNRDNVSLGASLNITFSSTIFESAIHGIEVSGTVTDLTVERSDVLNLPEDQIYVPSKGENLQDITNIQYYNGNTYFSVGDITEFEAGDVAVGRTYSAQDLIPGQWYFRNDRIASNQDKLDSVGANDVVRQAVDGLLDLSITTDPGLISGTQRDQVISLLGSIPFTGTMDNRFRVLANKLFGNELNSSGNPTDTPLLTASGALLSSFLTVYEGVEDGSQKNIVNSVDESGSLSLNNGELSTTGEANVVSSVDESGSLSLNNGELSVAAESNVISGVFNSGIGNTASLSIDSDRLISTNAEINIINKLDTDNILIFEPNGRELSALKSTDTGGPGGENKLLQLDSNGRISPTAFGQINLTNTEVFETIAERNAFTGREWESGDVAIITGNALNSFIGTFTYQGVNRPATQDSDWVEIALPTGTVTSVAGRVGTIVLATSDIDGLGGQLDDKQDNLTTDQIIDINRIDSIDGAKQDSLTAGDYIQIGAENTIYVDVRKDRANSTSSDLATLNDLSITAVGKQNTLIEGNNIELKDNGDGTFTISVENTSGVQVTVVAFGRGTADSVFNLTDDGDSVTILEFKNTDTIFIEDLAEKGWEIFDSALDSDLWQVDNYNLQRIT